jgi:ribosomal protein S16
MTKQDLKDIIEEAYYEVLASGLLFEAEGNEEETEEVPEETPDTEFADAKEVEAAEDEVTDPTPEILAKFPTLKKTIVHLMTPDYEEFVEKIGWMSPKPSTFKVEFKNGQDITLKWMGKGFQATVEGKRYFLDNVSEYQQCLDKIGYMLASGPITDQFADDTSGEDVFGGTEGGGGEFPGAEGGEAGADLGADTGAEAPAAGGEEDVFAGVES